MLCSIFLNNFVCLHHRFIILNRGSREREESDAILPDRSVQRHSECDVTGDCALIG